LKTNKPWGGSPPADADEARTRLAQIATDIFVEKGMRKAFLSEVARIAGISRPTLYSYYPTKESLIFGAMGMEVEGWIERILQHVALFETAQERLVEGAVYAVEYMPKTRVLKFIADPDYISFVVKGDPGFAASIEANALALESVFELAPQLRERRLEIAELVYRTILSFLQYHIGDTRSPEQLRLFLHRYLVPAVGLPLLEFQGELQGRDTGTAATPV
jgi:AcrR family transcriptional regulator